MSSGKKVALLLGVAGIFWSAGLDQAIASQASSDQATSSRMEVFDGTEAAPAISLPLWRQVFHELQQQTAQSNNWPTVVELTRQTKASIRNGLTPITILDLPDRPLFSTAALKDYTHRGNRTTFVFDGALHFTSASQALPDLQADFDDGLGFRPVAFDEPFRIIYQNAGCKTIRVRALYPGGKHRTGSFQFAVEHLETPLPDETWSVVADTPYLGGYGSGLAYVYLADAHTSLTDPVLVIEGFDLDNSMNWDELYYLMNRENLLEDLRAEGFDFVILNFDDSTDYIQRHAYLAVTLIQQIQQVIPGAADLFVAGASMGGIVGRYALSFMEQNAVEHATRTFLAFDSPHKGANIPFGLQHWVDFFASNSAEAALLRDILNRPSARQQLAYHYTDSPPNSAASDPLRLTLLDELAALGNYPQNLRRVAISSGSGTQQDQGYSAGDQIILYEYTSFLVDIIGNVWAVPDGAGQIVFDGLIDQIWPLPDDSRTVYLEGTLPYDTAPGGFRPSMVQLDTTSVPYGDIIALQDNHCFIPTISSLDLATDDLFHDIAGDPDLMTLTPFDAVYFPVENQEHNIITPENKLWFMAEVTGQITSVAAGGAWSPTMVYALGNTPNPFNPVTSISYVLSADSRVTLQVFSLDGGRVLTLASNELRFAGPNTHTWDGRDRRGRRMPSGVYFYRLAVGNREETGKMVMLK